MRRHVFGGSANLEGHLIQVIPATDDCSLSFQTTSKEIKGLADKISLEADGSKVEGAEGNKATNEATKQTAVE